MSLLDQIVNVTITRQTVFPTQQGFGVPLLLAYHTRTAQLVNVYTSAQDLLDAGFAVTDQAYKMALKAFSQNPSPSEVVIGRRTRPATIVITLLPKNLTVGFIYSLDYTDATGLKTNVTYTVQSGDTAVDIGTAIKTAIDALASSSATVDGSTGLVTITASAAGVFFDLSGLPALTDLAVANTTADGGIVADYNAVKAIDSTTWYGVAIDTNAKAEIELLAEQIEAQKKIFCYETSDSACADNAITTDVMSQLAADSYARTFGLFAQTEIFGYRAVAWLAKGLASGAQKPGGNSWSNNNLGGITVDSALLADGSAIEIGVKHGNVYVSLGGLNQTYSDLCADNEHIDLIVGTDWLFYRLQTDILAAFYNAANSGGKIPYTDDGINVIKGLVLARLNAGVVNLFLAADPKPTCTVPLVKDIDPALRAARQLPDVKFTATVAGAINKVVINGTLSV